eukprot:TRINITY_DN1363_c0_g2_i7.p1 TRINITY_DN1363_c0_g2~~TRINITY_DN1363_c0_g2_i7.p1  ORF type:complete len:433 (+),score=72.33 TRINITY_DN1363_c0_g2_i7:172-1470(+)
MCIRDRYKTVVIDNGTGYTKMGYAGNFEPSYIIPTCIADNPDKNTVSVSRLQYDQLDFHIGQDAIDRAKNYRLTYPIRSGMIENWEHMEKFWHRAVYHYLRCDPENHYVILTEPPMNTPENREQMAEIFFETFNVEGLYIGVQAVLALYAGVVAKTKYEEGGSGLRPEQLTGTVVDSGDGVTHVIPVVDSFVVGSCIKHIPLAGRDITKFVLEMMRERGEKFPIEDSIYIAQQVKEKYGYVCEGDLREEFKKYDTKGKEGGKWVQSAEFKTYETQGVLTRSNIKVDIGYERFLGPEMFFHPEFISKEWSKPIDEVIDNAIQSSPIDCRRRLYGNIVLSGGSTLVPGFEARLQKGIQARVQERLDKYSKISQTPLNPIEVNVLENMAQRFAVWFGGSFLATNPHFESLVHKREAYQEIGPSIARYNPVFPMGM